MVWKASYGPVPLARALKGSGAMPLPPKNNVSDFSDSSLYNKKKMLLKGGVATPSTPPLDPPLIIQQILIEFHFQKKNHSSMTKTLKASNT